ncbi:NAD(P)-binding protein [Hyaloscypha variabilis]
MSTPKQTVLIIGGTGAQGTPVVQELSKTNAYTIHVLTRTPTSPSTVKLSSLPNVTIIPGSGYNEATLHSAFQGIDIAFVNLNGFAIGEKAELYWGIRLFELAAEHRVKHFIWASLPSSYKLSGYNPIFRTGHFDGKAKVADWISAQVIGDGGMRWSILASCMYLETFSEMLAPSKEVLDGEEITVFKAPVGGGQPPMIYLEDLGRYARWIVENPERSAGLNLRIATANVGWEEVARAFTETTGRKAVFRDLSLDEYFASGVFGNADRKVGHSVGYEDETLQTYRENFSGFWNTWKEDALKMSEENFKLLDEILPGRVRSVEEWMKLTGYNGERGNVLKDYADAGRKKPQ